MKNDTRKRILIIATVILIFFCLVYLYTFSMKEAMPLSRLSMAKKQTGLYWVLTPMFPIPEETSTGQERPCSVRQGYCCRWLF